MLRNVLIIVPHQDDELNVAAPLLSYFIDKNISITVCFVTNGDYDGEEEIRLEEAKRVSKLFNNWKIIYLGYGDGGYLGELYKTENYDLVVKSPAGHTETYGVKNIKDFHFDKYGCHAPYTKNNLVNDLKDVILQEMADLILCIDSDEHPDHKLVSESFDNAIRQVINKTEYSPLVLKKFAYLGCWYGENDYFNRPMIQTNCVTTMKHDDSWSISNDIWEKRVRFEVSKKDYPIDFWKSKIFKAYKCYKTQIGGLFFFCSINSDAVYWFYDTRNKKYELSTNFPISETPFLFANESTNEKKKLTLPLKIYIYIYIYIYILYALYIRIYNKLRRMAKHGF